MTAPSGRVVGQTPSEALAAVFGDCQSPQSVWPVAKALTERWTGDQPESPARKQPRGKLYDKWRSVVEEVAGRARGWESPVIAVEELEWLRAVAEEAVAELGICAAYAVAWGIDEGASQHFTDDWCQVDEPFQLPAGELYPVGEPNPVEQGVPKERLSTRPSSKNEPPLGELPHARRYRAGDIQVIVDARWHLELGDVARSKRPVVVAFVNQTLEEFDRPKAGESAVFPVTVADAEEQSERVSQLLDEALSLDARLVLFPELASSSEIVEQIKRRLSTSKSQCLVIAGSYHDTATGKNTAVGVFANSDARLSHDKITPYFTPDHLKEGITPGTTITVYEAGEYRFAIAICKDLLNDDVREIYRQMGVNFLLVQALSDKTGDFVAIAGGMASSNQAVTVMANGILEAGGTAIRPAAVLGQPMEGALQLDATPSGPAPAIVVFRIGAEEPIK